MKTMLEKNPAQTAFFAFFFPHFSEIKSVIKNIKEKHKTPAGIVNGPNWTILFAKIFAITTRADTSAIRYSTPYFFPMIPATDPIQPADHGPAG